MASLPSLERLLALVGLSSRPSRWKLLFLFYVLLNLKNIPGVWHVRVFYAFISHIYRTRGPIPPTIMPATLFQPSVIRTRSPWYECDYNMHKSNSTYFSDFDVARSHLVTWICRRGIAELRKEGNGCIVMLGGVHCSFKREIKPYQQFEIWTRVLAWDRKWLYIISHFVKSGEVQPKGWTLQPWRRLKSSKGTPDGSNGTANGHAGDGATQPHPAIYASAIAKYVFKNGRLTIAPARVLEGSGLLLPKPEETPAMDGMANGNASAPGEASLKPVKGTVGQSASDEDLIQASLRAPSKDEGDWDWQRIEEERARGMKLAEMFNGLDGLTGEFRGGDDNALGVFADPF